MVIEEYLNIWKIIEFIASILSLWCVWLASKNLILNWPISIIATILYLFVFYHAHYFSEAYLQVIFILFQCYGWYNWYRKENSKNQLNIGSLSKAEKWQYLTSILITYIIWYQIYIRINPSAKYAFIDSFLTVLSLFAIFLQSQRKIENWYLWIFADILYTPMFFIGGQRYTSILYFIFIIISYKGYQNWLQSTKKGVGKPTP